MNDRFDELTKSMALSVTRRAALKIFGVGLASIALASLGLANKAQAASPNNNGNHNYACDKHCAKKCGKLYPVGTVEYQACWGACFGDCCGCGPH